MALFPEKKATLVGQPATNPVPNVKTVEPVRLPDQKEATLTEPLPDIWAIMRTMCDKFDDMQEKAEKLRDTLKM